MSQKHVRPQRKGVSKSGQACSKVIQSGLKDLSVA